MNDLLADTHAIIWYLFEPTRLSAAASTAFADAEAAGGRVLVSALSLVEIRFLVEKAKLPAMVETDLWSVLDDPAEPIDLVPVSRDVARALSEVPRKLVPEMPDRIIAATALALNLRLVTCDAKIRSAPITTVW